MKKSEFLQELKEALQGEVSGRVLSENLRYYDNYISQEILAGRREEDVIEEIGSPRLIARTIIDSSEAAGDVPEQSGYYDAQGEYGGQKNSSSAGIHYFNLNKWYWKLLLLVLVILFMVTVIVVIGGIFSLLMRFAGPIILIWLIYKFIKSMK